MQRDSSHVVEPGDRAGPVGDCSDTGPALFTPDQVAEALGLAGETVRRWTRIGALPAVRAGDGPRARILIAEGDLLDFLTGGRA